MFQDPSKVMKLQPMELPADPGLSEVHKYHCIVCTANVTTQSPQQKYKVLLLRRLSRELVSYIHVIMVEIK